MIKTLLAAAAAGLSTMVAAAPVTLITDDFDGGFFAAPGLYGSISYGSGISLESHQSLPGMTGNMMRGAGTSGTLADAYTINVNNIPTHVSLDISFLFAFLDSWDSINGAPAPDYFFVVVDGVEIASYTSNNASGGVVDGPGTFVSIGNYGFGGYADAVWDASTASELSFAHTSSTLTLQFYAGGAGWQGGADESWGLDNLSIVANTADIDVPEPGMLGLFGLSALALGLGRRRL